MNEHQQTIDDAKRYTDLVTAGGWKDPDVDPIKMLADVLEAHEALVAEAEAEGREANDEQRDDEEAEREGELRAILTEIGIQPIDDLEKLDLKALIARLGEHYRSTVRAEIEKAEGAKEEAERASAELSDKLSTAEHELSACRDELHRVSKLALDAAKQAGRDRVALRKATNPQSYDSPTRKRTVKGRGAGPPQRKR